MKKQILSATILALILLGCSDPKAATKENFEPVINKYLSENKDNFSCSYLGNNFPFVDNGGLRKRHFQKYVDLGLITEETEVKMHKGAFMGQDIKVEINTYDLTELGKEHYKNEQFCFGEPKLKQIVSFTEPVDFVGQKVTEVDYELKLENLPNWYKIDTTKNKKIVLKLSDDGWVILK
ncbi:hypothetical protein CRU94_09310 [Arcobacter sp. AHV-9/2010]|uniref:hypothetical protein n=1 Tax=Arcobacter sp. AHV-9/2010 TaxID=2021861 RepID=UPI00100C30BA|nr:hypothetical protein [Arcobacter sp. CECT 9299]RXJ94018.1 hypothetical protein CRU94_09310 [Arcobacter sp. CECT 9299]